MLRAVMRENTTRQGQLSPWTATQQEPLDWWHIWTKFPPEEVVVQSCTVRKNMPPFTD
jgi:hypothetical protein